MAVLLLDLAYITVKSVSYLGYYTFQGLSTGISSGYEYFNKNSREKKTNLMIKDSIESDIMEDVVDVENENDNDNDGFVVINDKSEYFVRQNRTKFELKQLKESLLKLKEKLD